jgi:hypothetical protein
MNKKNTLFFYFNKFIALCIMMSMSLAYGQFTSSSENTKAPNVPAANANFFTTKNWVSVTSRGNASAQQRQGSVIAEPTMAKGSGATCAFIENKGQYGKTMKGYEQLGDIKFGYEGLDMPILFTPKGLIHLHREYKRISHAEEERLEKQGVREEEIERKLIITDRVISMEWVNANPNVEIISEEKTVDYYTYGMLPDKANGYKRIIYQNLYPGIDLVYSFTKNDKLGFEYSFLVKPGADLSAIKLKYAGDIQKIKTDRDGNLIVRSSIDGILSTAPISYYGTSLSGSSNPVFTTSYQLNGNEITFSFPEG